ncbi:DUF1803 domain-containing protein [Streptococcus sp. DD13]|uniref:DUF1803 domain-containing protein n=1 Tax=Streptococcus sp. DD13 TaxID=1777881 RepID=UPI000792712D|nr:DUF1803 domain-containing protein [Streptococcus sp. DD13]KXT78303.1 hypothetical protein STRDD13_00862 [Streptococcus sp. DD13]
MIQIFNPSRLTRQPFFKELVVYLDQQEEVILRQIKAQFPEVSVDKHLEEYIKAGLILRENKRYSLNLPFLESLDSLELDQEIFIREESALYPALLEKSFVTELANQTNGVILQEQTGFRRDSLTLSNYFYRLQHQYPLSEAQQALYVILGDVNPEYALKYMTTFLLKFCRKERVIQKRLDIFVQALVILGWIEPVDEWGYRLLMELDPETLRFSFEG